MSKTTIRLIAVLWCLATVGLTAGTAVAQVSIQIRWDTNNRPYYVDTYHHRHYVSRQYAEAYYRRRDPRWFHDHQRDWSHNPAKFDHDWRQNH